MLDASLEVAVEDGVSFRFTVTNTGDEPVELTYRNAGKADFAVYREGEAPGEVGAELWRWSEGRMFAQVIQTDRLEPGEAATFSETWPDPAPGEYVAEATLRAEDHHVSVRERFSV